ncbi:Rpn family recombination-promoting nuclease/putative transposase [Candidatus Symbiobacter mobilis]|uniref:Transposase n=1 Tax=Candidatus Symbiobacter mobilis CR TaxID=946483 RepID=U5NEG7_9BURK|nr:Rpn family recombination-promoting nuclease/putative transposase [Candidatus Symbiobacter mobilis]AGX88539.1 hypothetical protein Cenrod_2485 [Candidatus Symbiobacter mobilis CR]
MRFLDVRTDFAFKKVFGSQRSKPVLRGFLNAILEYEGEHEIQELEIVDPYQIPMVQGMKDTFVDVKAVLANGTQVIIEMQVLNVEGFEQRILYNAAKQYSSQLGPGEHYRLLNPVIALTFTDFVLFDDAPKQMTSRYRLMEKSRLAEYGDDIELVFVELPKFQKEEKDLADIRDQWLYFMKNAGSLEMIPEGLPDPLIRKALEWINEAAMTPEELEAQHKRRDFIYILRNAPIKAHKDGLRKGLEQGIAQGLAQGIAQGIEKGLEKGLEKGMEKGIAQGIEKGIEQGRLAAYQAMACAAHHQGMETAQIAQLVGCSEAEVRQWISAAAQRPTGS